MERKLSLLFLRGVQNGTTCSVVLSVVHCTVHSMVYVGALRAGVEIDVLYIAPTGAIASRRRHPECNIELELSRMLYLQASSTLSAQHATGVPTVPLLVLSPFHRFSLGQRQPKNISAVARPVATSSAAAYTADRLSRDTADLDAALTVNLFLAYFCHCFLA